jgi:hypothetical protein
VGVVTDILSFGPGQQIGRSNKNVFIQGNLAGNAHWPIGDTVSAWEFKINAKQKNDVKQAIANFKNHVPNYTPTMQCTSAALQVAATARLGLPSGVGPVIAEKYFYTAYKANVANPYHLSQQMRAAYGPPQVMSPSAFPVP